MKVYVHEKEADGQTFYYCHIGAEVHYRPTYTMWVSKSLLKADENGRLYLEFPVKGCDIRQGKKASTLILKHGNFNLYYFLIECGYRGGSSIDEIIVEEPFQAFPFEHYHSPRGNTGISRGVLVLTRGSKVKIKWSRGGRLYGAPASGTAILYADGREENLYCVEEEDLSELQEELKEV